MVDVFEEVEEQLRTERYLGLAKRALPWVLGLIVLVFIVVGGGWGWTTWQASQANKASATFTKAMEAQQQRDEAKAFAQFGEVAKSGTGAYKTLALLSQGAMRLDAGATDEGVKFFDQAAKAAPNPMLADYASLRAVYALLDTAPTADLEKRIGPISGEKRPYRMQAKEALAFLRLRDGKLKEARTEFVVLQQNFDSTDGMRERAKAAVSMIDSGGAGAMAKAAKQAAELPPPSAMQLPPGMQLPPEAGGAPQ
ncbi:MAG: tetratricopeptide repeat protein [Caulobacteraceae bacterium]|nr:tetratricopeptide repeat protein [Caulobacter sp.]RYF94733.1 MAG: tetratricopeptide repeat protein [Caulobacteraceae bacterium]